LEIRNRLSNSNEEYLYSGKLSDLISALCENESQFTPDIIRGNWISKINMIREEKCSPSIAEWAGELYFLNIYPTYVTSGYWHLNEEFDEDDIDYRGKDTISIEDFQELLLFFIEYIKVKYVWALNIYSLINVKAKANIPLLDEKLRIHEYRTFRQLKKRDLIFEIRSKFQSYRLLFSQDLKMFECTIGTNVIGPTKFYFEMGFSNNNLEVLERLFSFFSQNEVLDHSAKDELMEERFNTQKFYVKNNLELRELQKQRKIPATGRFSLELLKNIIGEKLFLMILDDLDYNVESDDRFFTNEKRKYFFSIVASSSDLSEYEIWIIVKERSYYPKYISIMKKYRLSKINTVANIR